jgi:hypothetical protein
VVGVRQAGNAEERHGAGFRGNDRQKQSPSGQPPSSEEKVPLVGLSASKCDSQPRRCDNVDNYHPGIDLTDRDCKDCVQLKWLTEIR